MISVIFKAQHNGMMKYNPHLHVIPKARHFTFKVLLAAYLHGLLCYVQKLDLKQSKGAGGTGTEIKGF